MTMLQLAGPAAETAFRISKLREQLQSCSGAFRAVSVHFLHFAHTERPLDASERVVLDALLTYGTPAEAARYEDEIVIVPRLGTISPWASKATDIARNCGLPIQRLERGRVYGLRLDRPLTNAERKRVLPLVHDRMTETVLTQSSRESSLFAERAHLFV